MKQSLLPLIASALLGIAVIVLFSSVSTMKDESGKLRLAIEQLGDSLAGARRSVDSLRAERPGLGEYMSTIQLHAAKLWISGQAANWKLAKYELDELQETVEAAQSLRATRDSVNISSVLESVKETQLPLIDRSIAGKDLRAFTSAYDQTLAACNGCHRPAGYEFIHIIRPTREPVTNQQWSSGTSR